MRWVSRLHISMFVGLYGTRAEIKYQAKDSTINSRHVVGILHTKNAV